MNPKRLVKLSNIIGLVAIILLIYWIFIFASIEIFGLKVFKEYITESFYMSILGILALMFGALMINIMFNLTRIADRQNADETYKNKSIKKLMIVFIASFPLIFALLVGGDYYTAYVKEKAMIRAAETIIVDNQDRVEKIADYSYTPQWLSNVQNDLNYFSKIDRYFPSVSIIVRDTMDSYKMYLNFNTYTYIQGDTLMPHKQNLIRPTTQVERDYLANVFDRQSSELRFSKHKGKYELFYPFTHNGKTIVFYFTEYQQYGKMAYDSYGYYTPDEEPIHVVIENHEQQTDSLNVTTENDSIK